MIDDELCQMTIGRLRQELDPFVSRSLGWAVSHVFVDLVLYIAALWLALSVRSPLVELAAGVAMGLVTTNFFLIGHDASHGSYTGSVALNRHIARLMFLACLHPIEPWRIAHNQVHHSYTNLKGKDFVWLPLSKAEFDQLSVLGRIFHTRRGTRSDLGSTTSSRCGGGA